jgi:hypothetical protein
MRNIGGRITPALLEQLSLLGRIGEIAGKIPGGGAEFHIIVLQHTDFGSESGSSSGAGCQGAKIEKTNCGVKPTRIAKNCGWQSKWMTAPSHGLN